MTVASSWMALALVPLVAWRVVVRFRRATGRQRLSRYRGPITLTLYGLLIGAVALANVHMPVRLLMFALALAAGAALASVALRGTTFEATPRGLFYTPHGPIGLSLAVLFVARLAYRVVQVTLIDLSTPHSAGEFARSPLTLLTFGLMAGYYTAYMLGLMRWRARVLRAKRLREAASASSTTKEPTP